MPCLKIPYYDGTLTAFALTFDTFHYRGKAGKANSANPSRNAGTMAQVPSPNQIPSSVSGADVSDGERPTTASDIAQ